MFSNKKLFRNYLPKVTEQEIGDHDENQNEFVLQTWRDFHVHTDSEILGIVNRHENGGSYRCYGPNPHYAIGINGFSIRRPF